MATIYLKYDKKTKEAEIVIKAKAKEFKNKTISQMLKEKEII